MIQSYDDNDYTINTSEVQMNIATLESNSNALVLSATLSNLNVQQATTIQLEVLTETRLVSNSVLKVHLSSFLLDIDQVPVVCYISEDQRPCSISSETDHAGYHSVSMTVDCGATGLCPDQSTHSLEITGLKNRYSTSRGPQSLQEVFIETFDETSMYQVDYSPSRAFDGDLVPGSVTINTDELLLTEARVGHQTSCLLSLDFPGLSTMNGDTI